MAKYLKIAKILLTKFKVVRIEQAGRNLSSHANALAGLASTLEGKTSQTIEVNLISALSNEMHQEFVLINTELGPNWMDPIVIFYNMTSCHKIRKRSTSSK